MLDVKQPLPDWIVLHEMGHALLISISLGLMPG